MKRTSILLMTLLFLTSCSKVKELWNKYVGGKDKAEKSKEVNSDGEDTEETDEMDIPESTPGRLDSPAEEIEQAGESDDESSVEDSEQPAKANTQASAKPKKTVEYTEFVEHNPYGGRTVLTVEKEMSISELLHQAGIPDLYDKNGKIGNLRKVLFFNKLSMKKAKRLPIGFKVVIPRELNKYLIINNLEAPKEE